MAFNFATRRVVEALKTDLRGTSDGGFRVDPE
jgi:hypothetical protein